MNSRFTSAPRSHALDADLARFELDLGDEFDRGRHWICAHIRADKETDRQLLLVFSIAFDPHGAGQKTRLETLQRSLELVPDRVDPHGLINRPVRQVAQPIVADRIMAVRTALD